MLDLIKIRQDLHKIPETAFNEHKTQKYILNVLSKYDNLKVKTFEDHTGIIAEYTVNKSKYTLFRSDMDALKIPEETACEFESTHKGFMHACGHDIHMTVLLGVIDKICTTKPDKNFLFLFQPAEEGGGGALKMLNTGYFDKFDIEKAYALHVTSDYKLNTVACNPGIIFGIPLEFKIKISGKSSHAAYPHKGNDALLAGFNYYQTMLSLISKVFNPVEPVIFHIGKINAGNVMNAVADTAEIEGTIRIFTKENREKIRELATKTLKNITELYGCEAEIYFPSTYDPVNNNTDLYEDFLQKLPEGVDFEKSNAKMVGEDFGFFTSKYKGLLFWLGSGKSEFDIHHPKYLPPSKTIEVGLKVMLSLAEI